MDDKTIIFLANFKLVKDTRLSDLAMLKSSIDSKFGGSIFIRFNYETYVAELCTYKPVDYRQSIFNIGLYIASNYDYLIQK